MRKRRGAIFSLLIAISLILCFAPAASALDSYTHDWGYVEGSSTERVDGYLYVSTSGTPSAYAKTIISAGRNPGAEVEVSVTNPDGSVDTKNSFGSNQATTGRVYGNTAWGPGMAFYGTHYVQTDTGSWFGNTYYIY